MCCGKAAIKGLEKAWWNDLRVGTQVIQFHSREAALVFLSRDIDDLPVNLRPVYKALRFRQEQYDH